MEAASEHYLPLLLRLELPMRRFLRAISADATSTLLSVSSALGIGYGLGLLTSRWMGRRHKHAL